ncbi:hypothetical protein KEM54_002045 [Ascosphaera aggregata]|nr:hypothetical protein KEM54_002045 [Ascosphaera aggregata]
MLFQCVFDLKDWDIFAAGGRYDGLIRSLAGSRSPDTYVAVGFNLSCTRLCRIMAGYLQLEKKPKLSLSGMPGIWRQRRCDVLVASFDDTIRLSDGAAYVAHLWANNISAELASETSSFNELMKEYDEADHSWIVIVKHDTLKVVTMPQKDDIEMMKSKSDLIDYLRSALHQRNNQENIITKQDVPVQSQETSKERTSILRWIGGNAKSKRGVKRADAEDQAYQQSSKFLEDALDAPIAIISVGPDTLEAVRTTRLSSPESWRAMVQNAPIKDHQSLKELQECLKKFASDQDENGQPIHQGAFVYSPRSGCTIFYDLKS